MGSRAGIGYTTVWSGIHECIEHDRRARANIGLRLAW